MVSSTFSYKNGQWINQSSSIDSQSVSILLVFADRALLENENLTAGLKKMHPEARLIFCSTAGEIYQREVEAETAVCVALSFDSTPFHLAAGNIKSHKNSFDLGKNIATQLPSSDLRYILVIADGNKINGDELLSGIQENMDPGVTISGGMAGDGVLFQKTLVGLDNDMQEGNVVLMGLYGNKIRVGTGFKGGWDVYGPERVITKSNGNILHEIDGENALDLYKKYLGKYAEELPSSALFFPISIKSDKDDFFIVRTILSVDEKNKTMTFAGNLPQGSVVRFMKSNFDRLIHAASGAGEDAMKDLDQPKADLALLVSCVGRKLVLANRTEEEVEAAVENFSKGTTVAGFFSYGEIAPMKNSQKSHLHNQTMSVTTFTELP